jgi:hypothetical protein
MEIMVLFHCICNSTRKCNDYKHNIKTEYVTHSFLCAFITVNYSTELINQHSPLVNSSKNIMINIAANSDIIPMRQS